MLTDIDVDLPVRTVYNQWTQFEEFPSFMDDVEVVEQRTDDTLHWRVSVAGIVREWDARITEQTPDQRIAWTAIDGTNNAGAVSFHPLDDTHTRVVLQIEVDPEGFSETVADWAGITDRRAGRALRNFKSFIESRGAESGGYRGVIERPEGVSRPHPNEHAAGEVREAALGGRADTMPQHRASAPEAPGPESD